MSIADRLGLGPTRKEVFHDNGYVTIIVIPSSQLFPDKSSVSVLLSPAQYQGFKAWLSGVGLIQDMIPHLTPNEREMLLTGLDQKYFDEMAKDIEDETGELCINAIPIKARDLKPGDLFSIHGPEFWNVVLTTDKEAVGQSVYIRTLASADNAIDLDHMVYKITIERKKG